MCNALLGAHWLSPYAMEKCAAPCNNCPLSSPILYRASEVLFLKNRSAGHHKSRILSILIFGISENGVSQIHSFRALYTLLAEDPGMRSELLLAKRRYCSTRSALQLVCRRRGKRMLPEAIGMYIDGILYGRKLLSVSRFLYGSKMDFSPLRPGMRAW